MDVTFRKAHQTALGLDFTSEEALELDLHIVKQDGKIRRLRELQKDQPIVADTRF